MNIRLTPEQEALVKRELEYGHFRSVEELLAQALQPLQGKELAKNAAATLNGAQQEAVREMLDFVEKNRTRLDGISVKDLIHEGHRL